jgi:hypothetical protein
MDKYEGMFKAEEIAYDVKRISNEIAKAEELSVKEPEVFKKVALGQMTAPEGMTDTAINIVYAEKMMAEGNMSEATRAIRNQTFKQTARGQEIAMEKARATNLNDPQSFIQQVIEAKMQNVGKKLWDLSVKKEGTAKQAATKKIKVEVDKLKAEIDRKKISISEAQEIIDKLRCK